MLESTNTPYVDETGKEYSIDDLKELSAEHADLIRLSNLIESGIVTIPISDYYQQPAKVMDMLQLFRAYKFEIQEKQKKL
jgi:hypothetical protein